MATVAGSLQITSAFTREVVAHQPWRDGHIEIKFLVRFNDQYETKQANSKPEANSEPEQPKPKPKPEWLEELESIIDGCELKVYNEDKKQDEVVTDKDMLINLCRGRLWLRRAITKVYTKAVMGAEDVEPLRVGNSETSVSTSANEQPEVAEV